MDPQDYSSHYSGQAYTQYGATSNPYTTSASYNQQYYHTSSGSEQGSYDYDVTSPADDVSEPSRRRSRGGTSSTSGGSSSSTSARRREQNRLAQRALRQRRETHIRSLEDRILHTSLETRHLASENQDLSQQLQSMRLENDSLRRTSIEPTHAAAARAGAAGQSTNPYAHSAYGSAQPGSSPYQNYAYSAASTPSSTGDPSPSGGTWPYEDPAMQGQYDPRYWQQNYAAQYSQQYQQQYDDDDDDDDDDDGDSESEEEVQQRPQHGHRRRK